MGSGPPSSRQCSPALEALPSCDSADAASPPSSKARSPFITVPAARDDEPSDVGEKRVVLIVTTGADADRLVPIPDARILTVGRAHECLIQIGDECLSRIHARVARVRRRYVLADSGSMNGTFRNGQRVRGTVELEDGAGSCWGGSTLLWFKGD